MEREGLGYKEKKIIESKNKIANDPSRKGELIGKSHILSTEFREWAKSLRIPLDMKFFRDDKMTIIFPRLSRENYYHVDYAVAYEIEDDVVDAGTLLINSKYKKIYIFGGSTSLEIDVNEELRNETLEQFAEIFDDYDVIMCKRSEVPDSMKRND